MSNFQCPHCGMTNIDCGRDGYKTPKEIELGAENDKLKNQVKVKNQFRDYAHKYKQCLDEIEEICRNSYTTEQQYYYRTSDMILQKIKEVKED